MAAAVYQLMDTDSASLLGSYPSEGEALRAVAAAARKYARDSEAVASLVLFRQDGPEDEAFIAEGAQFVTRALAAIDEADGAASNGRASDERAPSRGAKR
jgi:hypothetical protein